MTISKSNADVIVVGSGGAGLVAAASAADEGAKVLVLEKLGKLGGVWMDRYERQTEMGEFWLKRGGTVIGTQTRIQFESGIYDDSPTLFYADCMRHQKAREQCDPDILMFYCQRAGIEVDWMDTLGIIPSDMREALPGYYGEGWSVDRCYWMRTDIVQFLLANFQRGVDRGDIEFATRTKVTDLLQEDRKIVGVRARGVKEGVENDYRAGSVILCTGGFGANRELLYKYNHPRARKVMSATPGHCTGDGFKMSEKVGAKMVNLNHPISMGPYGGAVPNPDSPLRRIAHANMNYYPGVVWVDLNGKRVVNEDAGEMMPNTHKALEDAPEQMLIVILDQKIMSENPPILHNWVGVPERSWEWFKDKAEEGIVISKGDTIAELAGKLELNPQTLEETISTYNRYVASGEDPDFGRKELTYKLENPPFYGIKTGVLTPVTSGGPATNLRSQVIDETGKVIPGLYAAGEVAGYQGYGTASFTMGNIIFGKHSGQMAALDALYRRF